MEPFARKGKLKYYSRRPPVARVTSWVSVYRKQVHENWRGLPNSWLSVQEAEFIPNYYKLIIRVDGQRQQIKYFYGESAWHKVKAFAGDLGHDVGRE